MEFVQIMPMAGTEIADAMTSILGVVTSLFTFIMSNPLLMLFVGASLVPVGMKIFRSMKRATA